MQFFKKYNMACYWVFIAIALGISIFKNGVGFALIGFAIGGAVMELIAKGSYYLLKNTEDEAEEDKSKSEASEDVQPQEDDENFNINEYVDKNKRTFSEANTYLAAGIGAFLGWELFIVVFVLALLLQVLFIIPQFIKELYKQKKYRLVFSITSFLALGILYLILINFVKLHFYVACAFAVLLIFFAIDAILGLRERVNSEEYYQIPFGSFLVVSALLTYFYGYNILKFFLEHILKPM